MSGLTLNCRREIDFQGRDLVLVRAGKGHCMSPLLYVPREQRSWDLAISFYDEMQLEDGANVDIVHHYSGGKWDGIYRFFEEFPHRLSNYDYFWLVDDDIEVSPQQVNELLFYVRKHKFELSQPALALDSYYSHRLTLHCPGFVHRHSNLVEIMAPIVSRRILAEIIPLLQHTRSGFGIDWYWQRLVEQPRRSIAIIDAFPVGHRRPLRQHLRGRMKEDGLTPEIERERLAELLGLYRIHGVATGGLLQTGEIITSRFEMAWVMIIAYWRVRRLIKGRPWKLFDFATFFFRQAFSSLGR